MNSGEFLNSLNQLLKIIIGIKRNLFIKLFLQISSALMSSSKSEKKVKTKIMSRIEIHYIEFDEKDRKVGLIKKHEFEDFQIKNISIETSLDEYEQIIRIEVRKKPMTEKEKKEFLNDMREAGMEIP